MHVFRSLQNEPVLRAPCVFTFGTFDGVHLGHQFIFDRVTREAKRLNQETALLTFSNPPIEYLAPDKSRGRLTSDEQKLALVDSFGISFVFDIPFNAQLAALTADDFLQAVRRCLPFSTLVVGSDVRFGYKREGDKELLRHWENVFSVILLERFCIDGAPVSSSRIRQAILQGQLGLAARLLGRPYTIKATRVAPKQYAACNYLLPPVGEYLVSVSSQVQRLKISSILEIDSDDGEIEIEFSNS